MKLDKSSEINKINIIKKMQWIIFIILLQNILKELTPELGQTGIGWRIELMWRCESMVE